MSAQSFGGSAATAKSTAFRIADESYGRAVEIAPDFWIIATRHRPTGSRHQPEINNRCLIFRLNDASADNASVLLVANCVDVSALPEVCRIAAETGAPVRYVIAPGAGHSLNLVEWHNALTDAIFLVGPARIPRVAAGRALAASPRFRVFDQNDPLPMFHGQLEALNFDGIGGARENITPREGARDSKIAFFINMFTSMPFKDPHDELWLYHVASRTIIGGENLGWNLSKTAMTGMSMMIRMMMKAEQLYVMTMPRPVLDKARVKAHWQKILSWPADNVLSYHDSAGTGQIGDGQAALRIAVEKSRQLA